MRKEELLVRLDTDVCIEMFYDNYEKWIKQFGEVLKDFGISLNYDKEKHTTELYFDKEVK